MTPDKFAPAAWEAGLVDGKVYAIPLDTHPFVLFYNTEICKKAGLLDTDGKLEADGQRAGRVHRRHAPRRKKVTRHSTAASSRSPTRPSTPWRFFQSLVLASSAARCWPTRAPKVVIDDAKAHRRC